MVLRIHNHGTQKIKDLVHVYKYGAFQVFERSNNRPKNHQFNVSCFMKTAGSLRFFESQGLAVLCS